MLVAGRLVAMLVLLPVVGPPHQLVEPVVSGLDCLVRGPRQTVARLVVKILSKGGLHKQINIWKGLLA